MLTQKETEILRQLAKQYMEYAVSPAQEETQKLWIAHNTGKGQRPMVLIDQIPWHEMDVDGSLVCQIADPYWRGVEQQLRRKIYQYKHMPADMLLPPYMMIPRILKDPNYRAFGIHVEEEITKTDEANDVVSHAYIKQFQTMEDLEKIKPTVLEADSCKEQEAMETAQKIFEGIAPVYWEGISLHCGFWDTISQWQSVEECYYMLLDQPELLHGMMERMTNIALDWIRQGNEQGLFDVASGICHCSHTIRQPLDHRLAQRPGISQNSWAFGLAQLFTSVSPEVTREFELPYMKRIFEQFGDIYYGCCEKLDDRLEILAELPNVRKISCSPWSDPWKFAQMLPEGIIMSNKPNPALVACGNLEGMKQELINTMKAAKANGRQLEMILKDNSSVQRHPQRLWEFSKMALELVNQ
ncbi:MAG: hypothetical protein ACOX60_00180 [Massiliimalia sp.]|jgi:hypothetical protein